MKPLSEFEIAAAKALHAREKQYEKRVQQALANSLSNIRGEMSKIYDKYAKVIKAGQAPVLTRVEMTKYNKYSTMEKQLVKLLDPALIETKNTIKRLLPDQYNESFFRHAWAMDNGNNVRINWGVINPKVTMELFSITNPKNIELMEALKNYSPNAKKYLRNALLNNLSIGKSYTSMIRDVKKALNKTYGEALRTLRTEGQNAISAGQDDLYIQAQEKGIEGNVIWDATLDGGTRPTHRNADGQVKKEGLFTIGGFPASRPLDPALPGKERINCRCRERFEVEGYSPQLRRTREEGIIPYQNYNDYAKEYHPEWLKGGIKKVTTTPAMASITTPSVAKAVVKPLSVFKATDPKSLQEFLGNNYGTILTAPPVKKIQQSLHYYVQTGYGQINKTLRGTYLGMPDVSIGNDIKNISAYINKNKVKEPIQLYRGLTGTFGKDFKLGDEFVDKAFGSFSAYSNFPTETFGAKNVLRVVAKKGDAFAPAVQIKKALEFNIKEGEFIAQAGMKYKIINVEKIKGVRYMDIEVLP